jgi:DNA-binding XRE family transcriptional regulator
MVGRRRWLAERRAAAGLTQESLAARVEVERTTIARWETGATTPGLWVRSRLASALDLTTDELDRLLRVDATDGSTRVDETLPEPQERREAGRLLVLAAGATIDLEDDASSSWAEPVDRLTSPAPGRISHSCKEKLAMRNLLRRGIAAAGIATVLVLGPIEAAYAVGIGSVLIAATFLPVPFSLRLVLILMLAGTFTWLRKDSAHAFWPIVGSMFMFRLIVYLYSTRKERTSRSPLTAGS